MNATHLQNWSGKTRESGCQIRVRLFCPALLPFSVESFYMGESGLFPFADGIRTPMILRIEKRFSAGNEPAR